MSNGNTDNKIDVEIECPNCSLVSLGQYNSEDRRPLLYGKCSFCNTRFKWTKTKTSEVIPANRKLYIINITTKETK